jgi:hypothetical protein
MSVLLVEETGVPEKTTNLSQDTDKLDQIMLHRVCLAWGEMLFFIITYLVDKIEKVQMEAARIVTGGTRLVSLNNICLETGWEVG